MKFTGSVINAIGTDTFEKHVAHPAYNHWLEQHRILNNSSDPYRPHSACAYRGREVRLGKDIAIKISVEECRRKNALLRIAAQQGVGFPVNIGSFSASVMRVRRHERRHFHHGHHPAVFMRQDVAVDDIPPRIIDKAAAQLEITLDRDLRAITLLCGNA